MITGPLLRFPYTISSAWPTVSLAADTYVIEQQLRLHGIPE